METITAINSTVNDFVWGPITVCLIMAVGVLLTIRLKGVQFRNWGFMFKKTYKKAFSKETLESEESDGDITPFQAAMASISAVVGSGNIAGVAVAIVGGGPGALFWMIVAALIGMATKFGEIALGVQYRDKLEDGSFAGGPMYYIAKGLHLPWLGTIVAILIIIYGYIISPMVDTNTMVLAWQEQFGGNAIIIGLVIAVLTGLVIFGGITRIGEVCGLLSPFMAGAYLLGGLVVIILNIGQLPAAIAEIVECAFNPSAVLGGAAGFTIMKAMRQGFGRGIFSNEAGIGTAAITHASAKVDHPGEQALWGPFEVFVDTIIVCTISGVVIVLSGLWDTGLEGAALTMGAFKQELPGNWGQFIVLGALMLFGFSCLITYYNYVEKAMIFLFGSVKVKYVGRILWLVFIMLGAVGGFEFVWDFADTINGIVIYPNLIALILLSGKIKEIKEDYYGEQLPLYKEQKKAKKAAK